MDIAVKAVNVSKWFKDEQALHSISHEFEAGRVHGIVGNNGSGKTVFFKCVCGLLLPEEGDIYVEGKHIGKDVDFPASVGLIIETPGFLPNVSGFQNLKLLAALKGSAKDAQIEESIRKVGLDPKMKKHVGKYSLGMKQRLGIAQAIMEDPSCLILDEPFNGLDKHGVTEMRELINGLRDGGKTVLMASHNAYDIEELCDTVCEMEAGVLTQIRQGSS